MSTKTIINTGLGLGGGITTLTTPASSTDREIVIWDGTTGKSIGGGHGVLISALGEITDATSLTLIESPAGYYDTAPDTVWIDSSNGHLHRGPVDLESSISPTGISTDNAITRWDGNTGDAMQNSGVLLSDDDRFSVSGQTLLYADPTQRNFIAGRMPLYALAGSNNTYIGVDAAAGVLSITGSNNTAVGTDALYNLGAGNRNTVLGQGAGSAYTGAESNNICIDSLGVVGESNTTRIGTSQTRCFIQGAYGVAPGGTTAPLIIKSDGQLGTASGTAVAAVEDSGGVATSSPLGSTVTVRTYKIGKMVTVTFAPLSINVVVPTSEIVLGAALAVNVRPPAEVMFPAIFRSGGAYDTGLVGAIKIASTGAVTFARDIDASPSTFSGDSGWASTLSVTYLTA